MVIKDPSVAKLFADSCRRSILHNLRHYEMTPYQLSKALGKNVSSIIYHLNSLENAGLVEQSRTVVKGNLIEKYYTAAARMFIISYTLSEGLIPGSEEWSKEVCNRAAESLEAFGYKIQPERMSKLLELIEKYSSMEQIAHEDIISIQKKPAYVSRPALKVLLSLLSSIRLYKNPEFLKLLDEMSSELAEQGKNRWENS
jgi:DNA-binding transcriptional ArsR family regulator